MEIYLTFGCFMACTSRCNLTEKSYKRKTNEKKKRKSNINRLIVATSWPPLVVEYNNSYGRKLATSGKGIRTLFVCHLDNRRWKDHHCNISLFATLTIAIGKTSADYVKVIGYDFICVHRCTNLISSITYVVVLYRILFVYF